MNSCIKVKSKKLHQMSDGKRLAPNGFKLPIELKYLIANLKS